LEELRTSCITCARFVVACWLIGQASLIDADAAENDGPADERQIAQAWSGDYYPYYLADPRSARSYISAVHMVDNGIEDSGDTRYTHGLGKRFDEQSDQAWQFDFDIGYFASFDVKEHTDNIGWDGLFGLYLSRKLSPEVFVRFGTFHNSAHLGDEYVEETGRERINYTREELISGIAWLPRRSIKMYTELGWAWDQRENQEPLRWQFGAAYYGAGKAPYVGLPWYAAADVNLFEERDWEPAIGMQLGLIYAGDDAVDRYRFVLEVYDGRSVLGEFSFEDETYLLLGIFFDF
jgi:hypothetical protein